MDARVIDLATLPLHERAAEFRRKKIESGKAFPDYEWQRLSYAFELVKPCDKLLEVGPGHGYLSDMIARSGKVGEQIAIDLVEHKNLVKFGPGVNFRPLNIVDLDYENDQFDTVICMEVLEHLADEDFVEGLQQIRRVCRNHLIMSVPFLEPLPLPSYHKQRFDRDRVTQLFPEAEYTLLFKEPVTRVPWLLVEERMVGSQSGDAP